MYTNNPMLSFDETRNTSHIYYYACVTPNVIIHNISSSLTSISLIEVILGTYTNVGVRA